MSTPKQTLADAPQQVIKLRRDYNAWVGRETLEDYALRYTPQRFRRWSAWRVANTAFGAASFLVLEAVGATLLIQYGWANAFWAILATGLIIFLAGLPISVYAARYGLDMDLLTRGAGFGYIGSTLSSLVYASFTFIFFALEAAVMAYALELALDIPPRWGYLVCALAVIPLVTHGVSAISRLQLWTQPLWLAMLIAPYAFVLYQDPAAFAGIVHQAGDQSATAGFDLRSFGAALTVGIALISQMGEQADYLRFMPAAQPGQQRRWWAAVLMGGPGWVLLGVPKMLGGAALAWLALGRAVPPERAVDPNQMYLAAYETLFPHHYGWAVAATAAFVLISQLKINVTNAYAGSLAWSNFFSRLTHSHPGRVVWVVFNIGIALLLMEMNVFEAMGDILGLFANIAIAWIMAVVADLVISKPLGLAPQGIEFRRAYLFDINPVGVGAMALASSLSIAAHLGLFGPLAQAFSALIAMATALTAAPLIAWATGGRYYLARPAVPAKPPDLPLRGRPPEGEEKQLGAAQRLFLMSGQLCVICEREYEAPDMAHCPAYQGNICSLCCTLDARCGDLCKPQARLAWQWNRLLQAALPRRLWPYLDKGLAHFLLLMGLLLPLLAALLGLLCPPELRASWLLKTYLALAVVMGIVAWWLVLAQQSRTVAQEESRRQTQALMQEIASHRRTDQALQLARRQAEQANQAKSRYISAVSHELRTPLNSILGYAQLMAEDGQIPPHRQQAVQVIKRSGEHLMQLIDGSLDIARIEAGKLTLSTAPVALANTLQELAEMFQPQAAAKGLRFRLELQGRLPDWVKADEKRLRQILINLIANAIKFTQQGQVTLRARHAREMALIEISDSGPGLTAPELARIFEPFSRGDIAAAATTPGAGLGLTIAKMLTDLMGGELNAHSVPGQGAVFSVRLFLPQLHGLPAEPGHALQAAPRRGYAGPRQSLLVVDNEEADRQLLAALLQPLGFELRSAANGHDALTLLASGYRPAAVLMDLAMPGIDGWETLQRLRQLYGAGEALPAIAIVSANAFEKGQDNAAAIPAEDFILKPLRHAELLDWLGLRLQLQWLEQAAASPLARPEPALLGELRQALHLGHYRGVLQQLDKLQTQAPQTQAFCQQLLALARQYQFETMLGLLDHAH